jgi:hypothetical protein
MVPPFTSICRQTSRPPAAKTNVDLFERGFVWADLTLPGMQARRCTRSARRCRSLRAAIEAAGRYGPFATRDRRFENLRADNEFRQLVGG